VDLGAGDLAGRRAARDLRIRERPGQRVERCRVGTEFRRAEDEHQRAFAVHLGRQRL
jgi:hypothetical protein